jgi:hypothetical protein
MSCFYTQIVSKPVADAIDTVNSAKRRELGGLAERGTGFDRLAWFHVAGRLVSFEAFRSGLLDHRIDVRL